MGLGRPWQFTLEKGRMKYWALMICTCFLSSCVHTAIAPICTPEGAQAVIRIPNARYGEKVSPEALRAVDEKIEKGIILPGGGSQSSKPDPGFTQAGLIGLYGDVKTKRGERFVGYCPVVVIRSTLPAAQVDRAAGVIAASSYRSAKKSFQVIPITDLVENPKKKP
jgi:hypothetical protein